MRNKASVMPHEYYDYGMSCLQHFMQVTNKHNYKLMNAYAKTVLSVNEIVLIQVKNVSDGTKIQIKCTYENKKLTALYANNNKIALTLNRSMLLSK